LAGLDDLGLTGDALKLFGNAASDATKASVGLAGNLLSGSQKISDYSSAITSNTKLLGKFDKVVSGLVQFAENSLSEYQALSGIGASFGKEMSQIKIAAAELGISVEQMTGLFKKNTSALKSFGGTTDQAINRFRSFSASVLDSDLGTQLRRLGYTAEDINGTLLTYNEIAEQDGNMGRRTEAQRAASAKEFAVQMDGLAKMTGKQRQQIEDEMKATRRRGDVQAFLMDKNADEQAAFTLQYQKLADTMGKDAADAFADLAIRGAPTTEATRNAIVAMGPAADQLANAASEFNSGNIAGFNNAITKAQGATLDYLKTDEARQAAMLGGMSNISSAFGNLYEGTYDLGNAVEGAAGANEDSASVIQDMQTQITQEQARQMEQTGGLLDKTIQVQEAIRDMTVMATTEALPRLEEMAMAGIDKFMAVLPSSQELAKEIGGAVGNLFNTAEASLYGPEIANAFGSFFPDDPASDTSASENAKFLGAKIDGDTEATLESDQQTRNAVVAAQEKVAELTDKKTDMLATGLQEADGAIQGVSKQLAAAKAELLQAQANSYSASQVAQFKKGGNFAGGFANGGRIGANEIGIAGEAGAEFIAGPAQVMSAKTSMGVMQTLVKGVGKLESRVQESSTNSQNQVSSNVVKEMSSNMDSKFDSMIRLLSQLVSVEAGAASTAQRSLRATKGLQGNMLKGIGA
tara:strand:- start:827 stop:2902 length:2076 start_codon:yes stop_codon:yes gene_type:complete